MNYSIVDDLNVALVKHLAEPGYSKRYRDENDLESDVWVRLVKFMSQLNKDTATSCLTSHTQRKGRSDTAWKTFCRENCGPDVNVLGSKNRLDIVVKHLQGSIGIEVKCLGNRGHAAKLTQGLGQAMLALAHRDRTILMIHCGTVKDTREREKLRAIAEKICRESKTSVIVVP
jgi:hypothetical protein